MHLWSILCREIPFELLQIDDIGLTVNTEKLQSELPEKSGHSETEEDIEILEQLHDVSTGQTEALQMFKDVDQTLDSKQSATSDDNQGASVQVAEHAERIEDSPEIGESEQQNCDQMTSEDSELSAQPDHCECERLEMTRESEIQANASNQTEEQHCEASAQSGQSQLLDQPPRELIEQPMQLENAEETKEPTQADEIVCVEAEKCEVADQQEQTETLTGQNEQLLQTDDVPQSFDSEQFVQPEKVIEAEIPEKVSHEMEVTQQTEDLNQVDKQPETSDEAEDVGDTEDGDVQIVLANGEQPNLLKTSHMNGGGVDREMARRLAEQLFKLDGIQRVDVVKHLDKE